MSKEWAPPRSSMALICLGTAVSRNEESCQFARAFQLKAIKGDFSARREEVRRDFQAPAQGSDDPNPVLSSVAVAPGPGTGDFRADSPMFPPQALRPQLLIRLLPNEPSDIHSAKG